ncbi:hypothetical protein [Peribacillus sp. NPDC097295]|uniref:hypothetical protein n=1 Tax=Peribacillus sp. NPDC097295 TaxID=3364402 RepID=UPI00381B273B
MKKTIYGVIWGLVLIVINMGAFPIALFSLFGTSEGTSIFSLDYLIAFSIVLLANIITIQLFISFRRQNQKDFLIGLIIAIIEVCSFVLFINGNMDYSISLTLAALSVVGAILLLIRSRFR